MRLPICLLTITVCLASGTFLWGHEDGEHDHSHADHHATADKAITSATGVILPETGSAKPWSDKPVLNDPERFQFAIVTDRTGGHRPGVWMHAARNLNMLRPEFVVSVGDLIEGYSTDVNVVEEQWKEFLGFVDQLDMKFFFVAGNHDVTNPTMHQIWRQHFGREWYSFDYKGVHFVCLCSEDPAAHIGDDQLAWVKEDLSKNADARWTFVFMHKPLWTYAEREIAAGNPDPTNWKEVEKLLADRPHNVFAGHTHNYVQFERNDTKYYQFATTGGASQLRGAKYGEFDHVIWLTMEKEGPHLANILLDGVLPPDVVTEEKIAELRQLLAKTQLQVEPILIRNQQSLTRGELVIRGKNGFAKPIEVRAEISGFPLSADGDVYQPIRFEIPASQAIEYRVNFEFPSPVGLPHFAKTTLTARITSHEEIPTVGEISIPVIIDELFEVSEAGNDVRIDGDISDRPQPRLTTPDQPLLLGTTENWQGPADGSLQFAVSQDKQSVHIFGQVNDDTLVRGKDTLIIRLDPRSAEAREKNPSPTQGVLELQCPTLPDTDQFGVKIDPHGGQQPEGKVQTAIRPNDQGYSFEVAIPRSFFPNATGDAESDFQMTLALLDIDGGSESPVYIIWRGTDDIVNSNVGLGTFVLP